MTKAEFSQLKKGSWLENTSGLFEVSDISPDGLFAVKELIYLDTDFPEGIYGITSYITRSEVKKMELIAV